MKKYNIPSVQIIEIENSKIMAGSNDTLSVVGNAGTIGSKNLDEEGAGTVMGSDNYRSNLWGD